MYMGSCAVAPPTVEELLHFIVGVGASFRMEFDFAFNFDRDTEG